MLEVSAKRRVSACVSSAPARAAQPATLLPRRVDRERSSSLMSLGGRMVRGVRMALPGRVELCCLGIS